MPEDFKQILIRMKPELLERIKATARALGMSTTAFIVKTLEGVETFPSEVKFNTLERRITALEERMEEVEKKVN